jgi:hypothetical protein
MRLLFQMLLAGAFTKKNWNFGIPEDFVIDLLRQAIDS